MRKYNNLGVMTEDLISPQCLIDLRLQGLSFAMIAKRFGITKSAVYHLFQKYKADNFNGYCPIDLNEVRKALNTEQPFSRIAFQFNLDSNGLRNLMTDYDIDDRVTIENVQSVLNTAPSIIRAADHFGIRRDTLKKFMMDNGIQYP